jgi:predicted DNA-binding protein
VPVSTPMKLCTYRMGEAEKKRLQQLAAERNVTLSYAIREGLRLYLEEWSSQDPPEVGTHVATT